MADRRKTVVLSIAVVLASGAAAWVLWILFARNSCPVMACDECGPDCVRIENREGAAVHLEVFDLCAEAGEVPPPLLVIGASEGRGGLVLLNDGDTICSKPVDDRLLRGELWAEHVELDTGGRPILGPYRWAATGDFCDVGHGRVACLFWESYE